MMVTEGHQNIAELSMGLLRALSEHVPQLDMAYPMWLEMNATNDPQDNQSRFRDYLIQMQPELKSTIEVVLPIYFAALALVSDMVSVEFSVELTLRLKQIENNLIQYAQQVTELEDLLALL
jgi:hypothetical protein